MNDNDIERINNLIEEDPALNRGIPERKEQMNNVKTSNGAEAPMSVTICGWYKGYSVLITKRDPEASVEPLLKSAMGAIDWMDKNEDWNSSWKDGDGGGNYQDNKEKQESCDHVNTEVRISRSEKNPGRKYKRCVDCNKFLGWVEEKQEGTGTGEDIPF